MFASPPSGWDALQERAQRAETTEELSKVIAEMNAVLKEYEASLAAGSASAYPERHYGDHTCVFYDTETSLLEFLIPYFAEGLRKGEYCFGAQRPGLGKHLLYRLKGWGREVERALRRGALEIHTVNDTYFPDNHFAPLAMIDRLHRAFEKSQTEGFSGLRTAGDLTWALTDRKLWDRALNYEKLVDQFIHGKAMTSVCQYHAGVCTPEDIAALAGVHTSQLRCPPMADGTDVRSA